MTTPSSQIENILPLDDLKGCMVNCYAVLELLENQKNDFLIPSLDKMHIQKIEYQFSKYKEQILTTLKGFYDLVEIINFINKTTEDNKKILAQLQKKLAQCSNEDKKNYQLVFDATQKFYNTSIVQLTTPCFNFFSEFINLNLDAHNLQGFLNQLEILSKVSEKYDLELKNLANEIQLTINKTKDLHAISLMLKKEILKT